jgi:T5SS/PEP-CTERM-associated repeat protein
MSSRRIRRLMAAALGVAMFGSPRLPNAFAQDQDSWSDGSGNWSDPDNWDGDVIPQSGQDVDLGGVGDTITLDIDASVGNVEGSGDPGDTLIVPGTTLSASGEVNVGMLTVTSGGTVSAGEQIVAPIVSVSSGTLDGYNLWDGTFNVSQATINGVVGFDAQSDSSISSSSIQDLGGTVEAGIVVSIASTTFGSNGASLQNFGGSLSIVSSMSTGLGVLDTEENGRTILDNSSITLGSTGFDEVLIGTAGGAGQPELIVQNSAMLSDGGNSNTQLLIGSSVGELNVLSGGQVSIHSVYSGGVIVVDGSGSSLTASKTLEINSLEITNGGVATTGDLQMGTPGTGGQLDVTGEIEIFNQGSQLNNTSTSTTDLYGIVTVEGTFKNAGSVVLNDGPLDISGGGVMSATSMTLANAAPVTATIDGVGSAAVVSQDFEIDGNSNVTLTDGGQISVTGTGTGTGLIVGNTNNSGQTASTLMIESAGGVGTGNVDIGVATGSIGGIFAEDFGSEIDYTGSLIIGDRGNGALELENGATLGGGNAPIIGNVSGGTGLFSPAQDTQTTFSGTLIVGNGGDGIMQLAGGAIVSDDAATIAAQNASAGTVSLTNASTTWTSDGNLIVAQSGTASLDVGDGAVANSALSVPGSSAIVGQAANSNGSISVVGTNSQFIDGGDLTIGDTGNGSLFISNGAVVTTMGDATIAGAQTSESTATITAAAWNIGGSLTVANSGTAMVTISSGGLMSSGPATVAESSNGLGLVTLTGEGSQWDVNGQLTVGDAGTGEVDVQAGAFLTSESAIIGSGGGDGTVTVSGTGSQWTANEAGGNGIIYVGLDGTGTLTVSNHGTVIANAIDIDAGGTLDAEGGTIDASVTISGGGLTTGGGTTLTVNGTLTQSSGHTALSGRVIVSGLVISSGQFDVGSGSLLINYGSATDPIATIRSYLTSGYNGGAWNGVGVISSTVASLNASQSALIYSVGYADGSDGITGIPSGEIEILPTLAGDAKMQGNVVFGDFQLLSQYFGQTGTTWDEGNFTYGSSTNFGDFQLLSQNFGASSSALTSSQIASMNDFAEQFGEQWSANPDGVGFALISVPEPSSALLLAAGVVLAARRRRRAAR